MDSLVRERQQAPGSETAEDVAQARPWTSVFTDEELAIYELYRRPGRPEFPWQQSALLVVDVTNEFLGSRLPTIEAARELRTACGIPAWEALGPIRALLSAFREAGRPIFYTKALVGSRYGGAAVGAADPTETSEIAEAIAPSPGDTVIAKLRASAFFGTPLAAFVMRDGVRGLVVVGGATSGCVRATVVDGASLGLSMVVAHDGCFDRSQLSHNVTLHELDVKYATVTGSRDAIERLRQATVANEA